MLKQLEISEYGVSMRSMFTAEERAEFRAKEESLDLKAKQGAPLDAIIAFWAAKKETMISRIQRRYERMEAAKVAE